MKWQVKGIQRHSEADTQKQISNWWLILNGSGNQAEWLSSIVYIFRSTVSAGVIALVLGCATRRSSDLIHVCDAMIPAETVALKIYKIELKHSARFPYPFSINHQFLICFWVSDSECLWIPLICHFTSGKKLLRWRIFMLKRRCILFAYHSLMPHLNFM